MEAYHIIFFVISLVTIGVPTITVIMLNQTAALKLKPFGAILGILGIVLAQPLTVIIFIDLMTLERQETETFTHIFYTMCMVLSIFSLSFSGLLLSLWPYLPGVIFNSRGWKIGIRITLGILAPLVSITLIVVVISVYAIIAGFSGHPQQWAKSPADSRYFTIEYEFNMMSDSNQLYIRDSRYSIFKRKVGSWSPSYSTTTLDGQPISSDLQAFWTMDGKHVLMHEGDHKMSLLNLETETWQHYGNLSSNNPLLALGFVVNPLAFIVNMHNLDKAGGSMGTITLKNGETMDINGELYELVQKIKEAGGLTPEAYNKSPLLNILMNGNYVDEPTSQPASSTNEN